MRVVCHINNLEKNTVRRDLSRYKMESGKEFLSVRRRYKDNVDCEEFHIHLFLFPLFGFFSHAFLLSHDIPMIWVFLQIYIFCCIYKFKTANSIKSSVVIFHIELDLSCIEYKI